MRSSCDTHIILLSLELTIFFKVSGVYCTLRFSNEQWNEQVIYMFEAKGILQEFFEIVPGFTAWNLGLKTPEYLSGHKSSSKNVPMFLLGSKAEECQLESFKIPNCYSYNPWCCTLNDLLASEITWCLLAKNNFILNRILFGMLKADSCQLGAIHD